MNNDLLMAVALVNTNRNMSTEEILKEKRDIFQALLHAKQQEFDRLSDFQEEQLESINKSKRNEPQDLMESSTEKGVREIRIENNTIDKLREQINYLEGFKSLKRREKVEAGSLVKTSEGNFLVAVPLLKFEANGNSYTGISTQSPLFEALAGHKEGEEINFNGLDYKIEMVA